MKQLSATLVNIPFTVTPPLACFALPGIERSSSTFIKVVCISGKTAAVVVAGAKKLKARSLDTDLLGASAGFRRFSAATRLMSYSTDELRNTQLKHSSGHRCAQFVAGNGQNPRISGTPATIGKMLQIHHNRSTATNLQNEKPGRTGLFNFNECALRK
ncbi:hypothetical protein [Ciceribacter thiooxidans]|uniref:Uncharacterized protein n=1 Tax=Ciceribacter thiooxidans TaxID=1969821 RepID=A0ABV7HWC5_9HYPH|nr:hypothetical protein [Ciceribacter thiooxidans]MDI6835732.1 hypothetical protein [Rhizobiaceae bacterium]